MTRILILAAIFCSTIYNLSSCTCKNIPSFYWHYNNSDKIFKAKVVSITQSDKNRNNFMKVRTVLFKIITMYKGKIPCDTILISTGFGHGDCGLPVEIDDVWLIFADKGYTNICRSNFLLERGGQEQNHPYGIYEENRFIKLLEDVTKTKSKYIKEYDSQNKLIAEGQIANGIATRYWKYHFDEIKDAFFEYPVTTKVFYVNGIKDSVEYEYFKNGKLYSEQHWSNGKENGVHICYNADGSMNFQKSYVNGKKDGLWKSFYKNGKPYSIEYFSLDKSVMTCTHFYETGDTSWVHYYDDNGLKIKGWMKYQSGKMKSIDTCFILDNLHLEESISFYENGIIRLKSCGYYDNNWKKHGEQIMYYENGNIKEKKYYDKGKEIGIWNYYDENGKLIKTENK